MHLIRLELRNLRNLVDVVLEPGAGLNLLVGRNGAGKTSVLEGLHLLAYGRSFRGRVRDGLVRTGSSVVEVFAEWHAATGEGRHRAGLRHGGSSWEARIDGGTVGHLGELCAAFMVVTFEPGSHALVSGGGEPRRRFVDWGLFHVEQGFLQVWRRYSRALKQRNALLKSGAGVGQISAWDHELAVSGEELTRRRALYLERLQERLEPVAAALAPSLGQAMLEFEPGWRQSSLSLADALAVARERDRTLGHTSVGPHRADWRLRLSGKGEGESLSRGQAKLAALSCLFAQATDCAVERGDWPVIALDDLASELDAEHRGRVLAFLGNVPAQAFITGTDLLPLDEGGRVFHVEQDTVTPR
ncbi:DNA replication/repair protein RecF [Luteimonas sp. Sa2BVA3]|uniref:DNA replication and repair protein RecF n=1 Tax=Luteimonas colneyensis TaxID=2762230 RepID=A0ABR8UH97_9GAMM|nr:DNA replication/repair protein RecF [Luteimonas colneyensis]MBD7987408.1 DNA replication/repair protein RecF [Luteimonas colneyensis]